MKELLRKLTGTYGPSGSEELIREVIKAEIKDCIGNIKTDVLGNLIAHKPGIGKKIMLAAHMDQIGLIVSHIEENGFLRFSNVGGISVHNILHKSVIFKNGLRGVVGYETEIEDIKNIKLSNMFIDIGASSREEAEKLVSVGDTAVYYSPMAVGGSRASGCAMDNRIGCAVLIESIKRLKNSPHDLHFVFTVQEELGLRGAQTSAYSIAPDIGIAVDATLTGDTPKSRPMAVKLGSGPAIKIKDSSVVAHPMVKNLMIEKAEEAGIPYQLEILERGGTDSGAIHLTKTGVPSGVISIPCRYVHSSNEMVDLNDMENAVKLLVKILESDI